MISEISHSKYYKDGQACSFLEKLGSPLDKEFVKIMDEQFETVLLDFFQMFSNGFKLGVKMMIEVLYSEGRKDTAE